MIDAKSYLLLDGGGGSLTPFKRPLKGGIKKFTVSIKDPYRPDAVVNCWGDDTGVRRLLGCTNFCAATDMKYNVPLAKHDIDYAARYYHYKRSMRRIGESATGGYFGPRSALMPWCIPEFWNCVEYGAKHDMRWQVTHGYQYTSEQERIDFEGEWARHGQERGLSKYIWLVEIDNEYWQNGWLRWDLDKQRQEGLLVEKLWKSIFNPAPYICMGSAANEAPDLILKSLLRDYVCEIHTARDREWMVKHVFSTWYMEGHPGSIVVKDGDSYIIYRGAPYCYGEPTPMAGGPDDFMGTKDPGAQLAMSAMGGQCGGAVTYFDGWDVRSDEPIEADAPTFETFPTFMLNIDEDACTWPPVHGGSIWHWGKPETDTFVTVMDELWYGGYYPPRPVAEWTAYGSQRDEHGNFQEGGCVIGPKRGKIQLPSGFGGVIIKGRFES